MARSGAESDRRQRPPRRGRHAARLAAVQALYQMELTGDDCESVAAEFIEHRFAQEPRAAADKSYFTAIVRGVPQRQAQIDSTIRQVLSTSWRLKRIDATLRAILRAAVYELIASKEVPALAVIDEYVEIAHAFFQDEEPGFVNAALDKIARDKRAAEFASPDDER
jgi:transcription antitermination protein NusB